MAKGTHIWTHKVYKRDSEDIDDQWPDPNTGTNCLQCNAACEYGDERENPHA